VSDLLGIVSPRCGCRESRQRFTVYRGMALVMRMQPWSAVLYFHLRRLCDTDLIIERLQRTRLDRTGSRIVGCGQTSDLYQWRPYRDFPDSLPPACRNRDRCRSSIRGPAIILDVNPDSRTNPLTPAVFRVPCSCAVCT